MESVFNQPHADKATQTVATKTFKDNKGALMINVGNVPRSGDIINGLDGKFCRFIFVYVEILVNGEGMPREDWAVSII